VVRQSPKARDAALQLESTTERTERPKRSTRNATRATSICGETGRPSEKKSSSAYDGRAMLQKTLELLAELRVEVKGLRQQVLDQREIIEETARHDPQCTSGPTIPLTWPDPTGVKQGLSEGHSA
jgi:hypothetical protein